MEIKIVNTRGLHDGVTMTCDGCGKKLVTGDVMVSGIESCCGACDRRICAECVRIAANLLQQHEAQVALPKAVTP